MTPFGQNCSLVWSTTTRTGALVDPDGDLDRMSDIVEKKNLQIGKILLTYARLDHAGVQE